MKYTWVCGCKYESIEVKPGKMINKLTEKCNYHKLIDEESSKT